MYQSLRDLLFLLPPELSHDVALTAMRWGERLGLSERIVHPVFQPATVMGLRFRNRIGLAAGLDKNGRCAPGLLAMGFGFIEVGTVTPQPQPGNPKPRLFRLADDAAIINRMGFNNLGAEAMAARLRVDRARIDQPGALIGVNIGKNKDTPNDCAVDDYASCLATLHAVADYVTVNISSPNTPGLRDLQEAGALRGLLGALRKQCDALDQVGGRRVPLLAKLSPDLDDAAIAGIAQVLIDARMDGVIATNTTISRPPGIDAHRGAQAGGLSGAPLAPLALACVASLARALAGQLPIIGVGGVHDVAGARQMIDAGASLVQIYTGFIYEGPILVRDIARSLGGVADSRTNH